MGLGFADIPQNMARCCMFGYIFGFRGKNLYGSDCHRKKKRSPNKRGGEKKEKNKENLSNIIL